MVKKIEIGICKICGGREDEHHAYESDVIIAPDNCVCFDSEWRSLYNKDGVRYIPDVCDSFEPYSGGLECKRCSHDKECHKIV
jgi:hypothetical protein